MYGIIYKTTSLIDGNTYIGQTIVKGHYLKSYLGSGKIIKQAITKYGKESFERETLCECESQEQLDRMERLYIALLKPDYNIDLGGRGIGKRSEETIEKMRQANIGKKHTEEHKRKISEAGKGRKPVFTEEWKRKISEAKKGTVLTEKHKKKLSISGMGKQKGKIISPEQRKQISERNKGDKNGMFGKHRTEEEKKKISEVHKGKTLSKETREKISQSLKKYYSST